MTRLLLVMFAAMVAACAPKQIQIAPVKIEPIHMTVDVNLYDGTKVTKPKPGDTTPDEPTPETTTPAKP